MGNFIQNLAKGFIRSAVNQVGRDGGKIISNQIYGDAHSTPYRNTSSQYTNNEEVIYKEVSPDEVREKAIKRWLHTCLQPNSLDSQNIVFHIQHILAGNFI